MILASGMCQEAVEEAKGRLVNDCSEVSGPGYT